MLSELICSLLMLSMASSLSIAGLPYPKRLTFLSLKQCFQPCPVWGGKLVICLCRDKSTRILKRPSLSLLFRGPFLAPASKPLDSQDSQELKIITVQISSLLSCLIYFINTSDPLLSSSEMSTAVPFNFPCRIISCFFSNSSPPTTICMIIFIISMTCGQLPYQNVK